MKLTGLKREAKGQALVEFTLILIVLLGFIFIIIESGRLFQGWLTAQNSARSAGRYALTGQFDPTCLDIFPPCLDPRVESIKKEARKAAAGLAIFADATVGDPNSFITEVWSQDRETGTWQPDDAGDAGEAVRIRVTYYMPIVVPLFQPIVETVRLRGQVVVNNEDFDQISNNDTYSAAPSIGSGGDYEDPPEADIWITKDASADEVLLGETLDYFIDVYNDGPFDAEGIIVTDALPEISGFIYTGYILAPGDGFCTDPLSWTPGTPVICQLRNLSNDPPLNHVQLILSAQTPYSLPGTDSETLDNVVTVESDQSVTIDPDLSNNQAFKQVILRKPNADIGISLIDMPDPTLANRPLNYMATVTNFGPDPTGTITATINIDPQIDDLSISFTDPNCVKNVSYTVVCTIPLGLAAGGIEQFSIDVTTPSTLVSDPMYLTSVATVDSDIIDDVLSNNTDTAITTVAGKLGDLYIEKASEFSRMSLGEPPEFSYFITVGERTGPDLDSASAITVTDQLPSGMTFVSSDPSSYCNNIVNPSTVICTIPPADIPVDPGTLQFEIIVRPESTGTFDNFVEIASDLEDATPQDNIATAQTIVGANDLAITKSASENIFIGEPFTYTLTVENLGPRDLLEGFTVSDTLPDGVTVSGTNGPDGPSNCSPNGGGEATIVAWCLDEFPEADSPLVFEITAISSVDGEIVNTASVYPSSENEPDPDPSNNEDSLTSLVQRKVDLVLAKSDVADPVVAGGQVSYNLQVWNLGPSFATEVAIVDNLPSVLTFDPTSSSAECSGIGQVVTCTLDMLPVGITETMTIVADVDSALNSGDTIQNTAVVSSFEVELVPENNTDTELTNVSQAVDLQIAKSDSPDPVAAGAVLVYTLEVENNGPSDASNVTISDELPSVLSFDPINSSNNCQATGQQVTCNGFNLAANEIQSFNVSAIVTSTLPAGASIQNTAIVTSTEQENNPGDNSASATTLVARKVDVQILKLDDPDPVVAGTVLTYTFRVRNNGPSDAFGVRFVDELPKWMTLIEPINAPDPVSCTYKKTNVLTLECDIGDMSAAETVNVSVQFEIPPDQAHNSTLLNTAEVFIDGPDENPANNISPEQVTTIVRDADLRIQKNASTNAVLAGESLDFSINVWNDGPSQADGVVINDNLADGLIFAGSLDGCSAVGQTVSCPVGTLQVSASDLARFSVVVDSALPAGSTITNTATVTSTIDPDSNLSNNTSNSVQISVDVEADLSVTKDDGISTIVAGENTIFTYQIEVSNNGPSDAKSVVVTDTWPSEYTLGQITTSSGSCAVGGSGFICTPDDIKSGDSAIITADYTAPANIPASSVTNQVEVSSATPDPNSPNVAIDTNSVVIEADLSITKDDGESIVVAGDGQTFRYSMVIGNAGPSDAIGVEVADNWPSGFSRSAINAPAGVTCSDNAAGFTCSNIDLLVGESITIDIDYSVPASTPPGDQTNSAQVTLVGNNDPDSGNNQGTDTTTVETWVDLSITKDDGINTPIIAGENVIHTFTFSAANNGTSDANAVVITDVWPSDYEIVNKPGFCTDPDVNDEISCTLGGLATGDGPTTFTIDYRVIPDATLGTTSNSVSISSNDTTELNSGDNSDTDANEVIASSDLRVSKMDNVLVSVAAGDLFTYTYNIIVTNFGPSDADSFSISDDWPAEFSQGQVTSSAGTCNASGGDFSCNFNGLASGSAAIVNAEFSVPASTALGVYTNTASILSATTPDPDTSNDSDSVSTEVVVSADLSISKDDGLSAPIQAGDSVTYTYSIVVTNEGPSDADAFSVSDDWPAEFIQGVISSNDGPCTVTGSDFNCDFNGLQPGETATITAEFSVPADTAADVYSNTVSIVNATTPDPDPSNDSETETTSVVASADLAISKDDGLTTPIVAGDGNTYTYEIAVTNSGPSNSGSFSVDDTWPDEFSQGTVTPSAGICTVTGGDFSCDFGGLLANETVTITAEYSIPANTAANTYTNTVVINNATTPDPDSSNDIATVGTEVDVSADLEITKADDVLTSVTAGDGITYTYDITVANNGPSNAGAFSVSDVWPTEFIQGSVTSADGICTANGGDFSCDFNGLQPNGSVSISAEFSVPSNVSPGEYSNTVSISTASTPDPDGTNDSAAVGTDVIDSVDLSINKSDGVNTVMAGTNTIYTYTITASNAGPSDAENVTIEDSWPADLVRTSISSTDGICTPIIDNFTCDFGTVTAGSFITISIAYSVSNSIVVTQVTNVVTATTTSTDSNIGNNDAEDTNTVSGIVGAVDSADDKILVADFIDWKVSVALTELILQSSKPL